MINLRGEFIPSGSGFAYFYSGIMMSQMQQIWHSVHACDSFKGEGKVGMSLGSQSKQDFVHLLYFKKGLSVLPQVPRMILWRLSMISERGESILTSWIRSTAPHSSGIPGSQAPLPLLFLVTAPDPWGFYGNDFENC